MGAIRFLHLSPPLQAMLDEALAEWELWKRHEPLDLVRIKLARARRRGGYYGAGGLARLRAELREARWKQTLVAAERRAQRPDRTPAERFTWALLVHHRRERDRRIAWEIRHYDALIQSILATLRQQKNQGRKALLQDRPPRVEDQARFAPGQTRGGRGGAGGPSPRADPHLPGVAGHRSRRAPDLRGRSGAPPAVGCRAPRGSCYPKGRRAPSPGDHPGAPRTGWERTMATARPVIPVRRSTRTTCPSHSRCPGC